MKRFYLGVPLVSVIAFCFSPLAAEKLLLGSSIKDHPSYYLPYFAAHENGFFKEQGLEVEWVPFTGGPPMWSALVAGAIKVGMSPAVSQIQAAARGVPAIIVSDIQTKEGYRIWVRGDSPRRDVKDLKGARIAVARLRSTDEAYGRMVAKVEGVDKDIKFIAAGGIPQSAAMLKTGAVEALVRTIHPVLMLKAKGEIRELVNVEDYLPGDWIGHIAYASKDFSRASPDLVGRTVRALLKGTSLISRDPRWGLEKMKSFQEMSEEVAKLAYESLRFTPDGKISKKGLANVLAFLVDYGIVAKDKAPRLEELYTDQFTR